MGNVRRVARTRVSVVLLVAVCGAGLALPSATQAAKDDTTLISRASGATGAAADARSDFSVFSANGRYVAFESAAQNIDAATADGRTNIFVRDLQTNTTTLASRATGANGEAGFGDSLSPTISADGRFVVFSSDATNLVPNAGGSVTDIFVRDTVNNTTTASAARTTGHARSPASATPKPSSRSSGWPRRRTAPTAPGGCSPATARATGSMQLCTALATRTSPSRSKAMTGCACAVPT